MEPNYLSVLGGLFAYDGIAGIFAIVVELMSIFFAWVLLQEVKWDTFFQFPRSTKARMLQVLIAVVLGHLFAQFLLQYWSYSALLKTFVE